ncbi:MAG: arsenic efflux protein [Bacteroidales bacterium]|nr:arsenic efflux protein [Bacteroidales bacterium]
MHGEWFELIQKTLMVSGFVLMLMIVIEYINVKTSGKWNQGLVKNNFFQLSSSIFLGLTPGCAGTFAVVSLYSHNIFGFFALLGATIATFGDEAFVIFSASPETAFKLTLWLSITAILLGLLFMVIKLKPTVNLEKHFETHDEDCCKHSEHTHVVDITHNFRKITIERAFLTAIIVLLTLNILFPEHADHAEHEHDLLSPESIVFFILSLVSLFIVMTVPEHFLKEHIWGHVLKKHFVRLFLWSFGTIFAIQILQLIYPIDHLVSNNLFLMLLLSIFIGILPISGPHLFFFTLFMQGLIPFSILFANSLVQEGHAGIPLLAEDKKAFVWIKFIKIIIAIGVGLIGIKIGF